jgi:hypothetical protein
MSVQFNQRQQVIQIQQPENDGLQHLNSPNHVPLDRMTSRSGNSKPYEQVQRQLTQIDNNSREERAELTRIGRIFDKVCRPSNLIDGNIKIMSHFECD